MLLSSIHYSSKWVFVGVVGVEDGGSETLHQIVRHGRLWLHLVGCDGLARAYWLLVGIVGHCALTKNTRWLCNDDVLLRDCSPVREYLTIDLCFVHLSRHQATVIQPVLQAEPLVKWLNIAVLCDYISYAPCIDFPGICPLRVLVSMMLQHPGSRCELW